MEIGGVVLLIAGPAMAIGFMACKLLLTSPEWLREGFCHMLNAAGNPPGMPAQKLIGTASPGEKQN